MTTLRVSLATAGLMLLSATTLSAQSTRIGCKDGSAPKVGHFTCWGHGGVVSAPVRKGKIAPKKHVAKKPATKADKKKKTAKKARSTRR